MPSSGPPPDAVTSYEDLPADLFGETGGEQDPPSGSATLAGRRTEAPAPATEEAGEAEEDTLAKVERAFPGRLLAVDPTGRAPEGHEGPSSPVEPAEDGPGDPADPSDPAAPSDPTT